MRRTFRSFAIIAATVLSMLAHGCRGNTATGPRPKASLGQSGSSQLEFRELSREWHAANASERQKLEARFRDFLAQYPRDELRRPAAVYLGWLLIRKGDVVEAHALIDEATRGPSGVARDFATVAEAALLTHHGRPSVAMQLLRPLQGKIIDPIERFLATEQLVRSAMAAAYYDEALLYSVDWSEQAPERDRGQVRSSVLSLLRRVPRQTLERALLRLEPSADDPEKEQAPNRFAEKQWLYDSISQRLAGIAVATQDVRLAQKVLTHSPSVGSTGEDPEELVRLATGGRQGTSFSSRTVGLLLATETQNGRSRSAEIAAMLQASLSSYQGEALELVFREDNGENTESALRELASGGSALIIAGVTPKSAASAARVRGSNVPLLLLEPAASETALTLGVSLAEQRAVLRTALGSNTETGVRLGPGDCPTPSRPAVADWKKQGVSAISLLTGIECARELAEQFAAQRYFPRLLLGLNAASIHTQLGQGPVVFIRAGHFPESDEAPADLTEFISARKRNPSWPETLAHDAATLTIAVLTQFPSLSTSDPTAVDQSYKKIRAGLLSYSAGALWSSKVARFDSKRQLRRTLTYKTAKP